MVNTTETARSIQKSRGAETKNNFNKWGSARPILRVISAKQAPRGLNRVFTVLYFLNISHMWRTLKGRVLQTARLKKEIRYGNKSLYLRQQRWYLPKVVLFVLKVGDWSKWVLRIVALLSEQIFMLRCGFL